jgi:hypothetical protein
MAANVNDIVDEDVKVGVDLDQAFIISFIPVVSSPGFIGNKFQVENFSIRQFEILLRTSSAFCNRRFNNGVKLGGRYNKSIS